MGGTDQFQVLVGGRQGPAGGVAAAGMRLVVVGLWPLADQSDPCLAAAAAAVVGIRTGQALTLVC